MIDTIYIAMTGLHGYEKGLKVIANNTANLNTPGFKSSSLQFADLFYGGGNPDSNGSAAGYGFGLDTLGTRLRLQQGQMQNTGNALDLAVDGEGMFVLRDGAGQLRYTRDGQFKFDADGALVSATSGEQVMAIGADGTLAPVRIDGLRTSAPRATSTLTFSGNISSTAPSNDVSNVTVIDAAGTKHTLTVHFAPVAGTVGAWDVTLREGTTDVGTGRIAFLGGTTDPAQARVNLTYHPAGQPDMALTLDFSSGVTSYDSGSISSLALQRQDGYALGTLSSAAFDATGTLALTYSNGQTVKGARLALGRFASPDAVEAAGDNAFTSKDASAWQVGRAEDQGFGTIRAGMVEASNVDLSQEFSEIVLMQRGYQASSQIVSTANEMLNDLFSMKGK